MNIFDINKFKKSLKTDYIGRNTIFLKKIDSTNNCATFLEKKTVLPKEISTKSKSKEYQFKKISKDLPEKTKQKNKLTDKLNGTVIISEIQTHGRGRFNRIWLSPAGGLWFTIILTPFLKEKDFPKTTLITAISIAEILRNDYNIQVHIKWPNDIYYKKSKLCGILTEIEKVEESIFLNIGVGLNVNLNKDDLKLYKDRATSIKSIIGKEVEVEILLSKILYNFEKHYEYYVHTMDFKTIFNKMENFFTYE